MLLRYYRPTDMTENRPPYEQSYRPPKSGGYWIFYLLAVIAVVAYMWFR